MVKKFILIVLVLSFVTSESQSDVYIKNKVRNYTNIKSSHELFKKIEKDFITNVSRVKAGYAWITLHIKYQVSNSILIKEPEQILYYNQEDLANKIQMKNDKLVEKAIKEKAGVCEHMALVLHKLCNYFSIENELIKGYVKNSPDEIGSNPRFKNHIWNAVKLDKKWRLIDTTFGVDYDSYFDRAESNFTYFDIPKEQMRLTHYPSDEKWLTYINQSTIKRFSALPMFWDSFIEAKAELVSPKIGMLNDEEKRKSFTFRNLDENMKITYKFENENFTKTPRIRRSRNYTNVIINTRRKGILTLYFNDESALAFRVGE
ncbi:transglutaminase domain-containing protein [Tenacibaculum sp. 190524A05c]|uniref:transglutaminase domain-containing protein n=1 Tax=Tenacibaculum platacis TaxID=3137852 RepID=UPI0032B17FD7